MSKKILLSLVAMLLVVCALLSIVTITGAVTIPGLTVRRATATATPEVDLTVDQQMDQIQSQVMSYRGLQLTTSLDRALMTQAELEDKVVNEFFADYTPEDAASDVDILSALGLLEPDFDLIQFYKDLYSEQIAGYYDDETKEMYVISGEVFGGIERMTYAHEFTHVLQDQNYGLEDGLKLNDDYCETDTEYCAAVTALIEGDATFSEYYWLYSFGTDQDWDDIYSFQDSYESPVYDSAPAYMQEDFLFPYTQGYDFVNTLYTQNQWQGIEDAYKNPPVSTEQIIHPDKYPSDTPVTVEVTDLLEILGEGWQEIDRNVMGEWYTYLILADGRDIAFQLPKEDAETASAGWGGDTYVYYNNPDTSEFVFAWVTQWDTSTDIDEFYQASQTYGNARWGTAKTSSAANMLWPATADGLVSMHRSGDRVIWLMAPNTGVRQDVLAVLGIQG